MHHGALPTHTHTWRNVSLELCFLVSWKQNQTGFSNLKKLRHLDPLARSPHIPGRAWGCRWPWEAPCVQPAPISGWEDDSSCLFPKDWGSDSTHGKTGEKVPLAKHNTSWKLQNPQTQDFLGENVSLTKQWKWGFGGGEAFAKQHGGCRTQRTVWQRQVVLEALSRNRPELNKRKVCPVGLIMF